MRKTHGQSFTIANFVRSPHLSSMTPAQCRAARALLQLSQEDLARKAGINAVTLRNDETERTAAQRASYAVMRRVLGMAGVDPTEQGHHIGPGVAVCDIMSPAT